jgi:PKD repeat protein
MKFLKIFALLMLLSAFSIAALGLRAQNAPVTTAGIVTNASNDPGAVTVPITVNNFISIGSYTLTLRYKASLATYVSTSAHPSFENVIVTNTVNGTLGKLVITWPQTAGGITLPDETHLLDLTFTYIASTCALVWLDDVLNTSRYEKYSNGSYIVLNDAPKASFYINGGISNRGAPVTSAPVIVNPSPGTVAVPVTVNNFTSIYAMTLNLEYNQDVLTYLGCTPNQNLGGVINTGTSMGPNGKMLMTVSWYGVASLADGSTVFTISFNYSTSNGNNSALNWYESGSSCEYADQYANPLLDSPTADYYQNGLIFTQYAPRVWLPVETGAPPGPVSLPVLVNDFNNVRSFTLSYEYDGSVMTYAGFTPDAVFGIDLNVTDSQNGSKRKIVISWAGSADKNLPDGSLIANVNFTFNGGTTTLAWMINDENSCRFNDANGNAYFDEPKADYYQDGLVASHVSPITAGGQQSAVSGQYVVVPVTVWDFKNIGLFSYTLDYDPSVLTYQSATLLPALGGTFTSSAEGLGRILMEWSGSDTTLADSTGLINLTFTYNGGATTLAWHDNGNSCRYAESSTSPTLYDQPKTFYYINGYTGPFPLSADFIANEASRSYDTTISLSDLSTGDPANWNWIISPSTYYFTDGTDASSQNPVIKFTSNGAYTVTLIVTRGTTGAVRIKTDYMFIGTPGLWTGLSSGEWNLGSNWHNFQVPATSLDIVIPGSADHWPHLGGDLTLGVHCQNLNLQDSAQFYVDGDFTINEGYSLTFNNYGILHLGGNWLNSGTFNMGNSTIDFTGPDDASILTGGSPESFYKIEVSKNNSAKLHIQGTVHVTGIGTE